MAYCMYLRKSRADKDYENSSTEAILNRHEKALLELAQNNNYKISQIFREVVSGETLSQRPEMQKLLAQVENNMYDGVLVMEVERLARGNSVDQGIIAQAFKYSNTLIITPTKVYDPQNEFDEEYFEFGLFMSRREYKTINRRLNAGRLASCKEGKFVGSITPYGYSKEKLKNQKGYKLVPDLEESKVLKLIFELYTNSMGIRNICKYLDSLGIKPRNSQNWSTSTIRDILKNPVYTGKILWHKTYSTKTTKDGIVKSKRHRNKDNFYTFDGIHSPLISDDIFQKAQNILLQNSHTPVNNLLLKNPFAGILYCNLCGKAIVRRLVNNKYQYLMCNNPNCQNNSTDLKAIEKYILNSIQKYFNYTVDFSNYERKDNSTELFYIDRELKKLTLQLNNIFDLLEQKWKGEKLVIPSIIIAMVWQAVGYYMVMYMASMSSVPASLYESANLDGAGRLTQFFQITIPLVWTNIRTTLTFFIISTINMAFLFVKAMTSGGPNGASDVALNYMYSQKDAGLYGYSMAIGVVIFLFSFALSACVNRATSREPLEF